MDDRYPTVMLANLWQDGSGFYSLSLKANGSGILLYNHEMDGTNSQQRPYILDNWSSSVWTRHSVTSDSDKNLYLAGTQDGDLEIQRFDASISSSGTHYWSTSVAGEGTAITLGADNTEIYVGAKVSGETVLMKIDSSNGMPVWSFGYTSTTPDYSVAVLSHFSDGSSSYVFAAMNSADNSKMALVRFTLASDLSQVPTAVLTHTFPNF